ncbi:hypothetical protein MHB75_14395 [Kurthia sp. FSL E2-0154]|uniref:hypothetical protein n=1 Tax=Kurthia sp. FSL E2-0154 TaxID=2921358 RepID=UPI0030F59125
MFCASDPFSPSNVLFGRLNGPNRAASDPTPSANDPNRHPNDPNLTFYLRLKPYKKPKSIDFDFEPFVKMKR